jgi:NAD(P)H-hydrate epimerase
MKLPSANEMSKLDQLAINKYTIPGMILMENAGAGTVLMLEQELGSPANHFALILVGPGNNGGDGLVIARHLYQRGCRPVLLFLVDPSGMRGDAAINLGIVRKLGFAEHLLNNSAAINSLADLYRALMSNGQSCYAIIDAILGIGLTRPVDGHIAELIHLINNADWAGGIPRIGVDIPSGLCANTGAVPGACIRADYTATYGCAKAGQMFHHGPDVCGKLRIIDIGIPEAAITNLGIQQEAITRTTAASIFNTIKRSATSHKGSNGHLLVIAGSSGKTGAAILSVKGALRSGCGLVSLCCPDDLNVIFETSLVEAMTIPLPDNKGIIGMESIIIIEQRLSGKQAIVLGPGLGKDESTARLVMHLYQTATAPMVIDADAITILAENKGRLKAPPAPRIFTPHPGEMARMLDTSSACVQGDRLQAVRKACQLFGQSSGHCLIVLKGAGTIIASENGPTFINTSGNPGMATGGMGDVLSGIIGSLLCQRLAPVDAACAGVYLHGMAGDTLQRSKGTGFTATELANALPQSINLLQNPSTCI